MNLPERYETVVQDFRRAAQRSERMHRQIEPPLRGNRFAPLGPLQRRARRLLKAQLQPRKNDFPFYAFNASITSVRAWQDKRALWRLNELSHLEGLRMT